MPDNVPFAVVRVEYGARGPVRDYKMPTVPAPVSGRLTPVIVMIGAEKAAGRNDATNVYASYLHLAGRPFAIIELNAASSTAGRAHKQDGAVAVLINPLEQDWYVRLLDRLDEHADKAVLLTVPSVFWRTFVKFEPALVRHVSGLRGLAYAIVASERSATLLEQHQKWLAENGFPIFPHRLVVRGLPLVNAPGWQPQDQRIRTLFMPFLEPQVREAMGDQAKPATFHGAWYRATSGTQGAMFDGVDTAFRDFGFFLDDVMSHAMSGSVPNAGERS